MIKKILGFILSAAMAAASLTAFAVEKTEAGEYSVPYQIMNAYNDSVSMADESRNGDMTVKINEDGTSDYYMPIKARVQENLTGHIIELWNIESTEIPTGSPEDYEIEENKAEVLETVNEKGLDGTVGEYASKLHFKRSTSGEDYFYIRVNVDAMGDSHQNAKIVLDWSNAEKTTLSESGAKTVQIDLWNSVADQASMGNVAVKNNRSALLVDSKLYIATNPVDVSGYSSALTSIMYDTSENGDYTEVEIIKTDKTNTGTKNDGEDHEITYISLASIELPRYITKSGVEYIPVKMQVPYTPMDAVAVGTDGYLDARLKIDWSTMQDTDQTELVPNSTSASGTSSTDGNEIKDIELKSMNVILTADTEKVSADAVFTVSRVTDEAAVSSAASAIGTNDFALYNFNLTSGGTDIAPNGSVTLSLPFAEGMSVYRINGDKKTVLKIKNENGRAIITSSAMGYFAIVGEELENCYRFSDMIGHWAAEYVEDAADKGLLYGVSDTEFSPESLMTTGMVITVLYRMAGEPAVTGAASDKWYADAVAWGLENDIIGDWGVLPFDPEKNITREEFATMLYRYHIINNSATSMGYLDGFSDSGEVSDWAKEALEWTVGNDIISGVSDTELSPKSTATRAQAATILVRYAK